MTDHPSILALRRFVAANVTAPPSVVADVLRVLDETTADQVRLAAENAKLRALVPGVEPWREQYSYAVRLWNGIVDGDKDPIPALTAFSDGFWRVRDLHGNELASGTAADLAAAKAACEAAAVECGVLA